MFQKHRLETTVYNKVVTMGRRKHAQQDKSFDGLGSRFARNIYNTMKGQLRLAILRRDFAEHVSGRALRVLDIGAGQGHWALELLRQGHEVTLSDVSAEMLQQAQENIETSDVNADVRDRARFVQRPMQALGDLLQEPFDVITCHAVIEWLDQPQSLFKHLQPLLKSGVVLSVIFYNRDGLIFKNMLRTNYQKVLQEDFRGARGSLTPLNPLQPEDVRDWAKEAGLQLVCHSGIRVFHDYVLDPELRKKDPQDVVALELAYSQRPPFRDLARYVHFLWQMP